MIKLYHALNDFAYHDSEQQQILTTKSPSRKEGAGLTFKF
jgi:predicted RNA-binding protein (virulence factor B family)